MELSHQVLGGTQKYYLISREGFSLVVMGFTGKKAMQWKVNFIEGEEWVCFSKMKSKQGSGGHNITEYYLSLAPPPVLTNQVNNNRKII